MPPLPAPANGEVRHTIVMQAIPHWLGDATPASTPNSSVSTAKPGPGRIR